MFLSPNPLNPDYKQWAVNHAIAPAAALTLIWWLTGYENASPQHVTRRQLFSGEDSTTSVSYHRMTAVTINPSE